MKSAHYLLRLFFGFFILTACLASLRVSREETLLILINLSPKSVAEYALNLEEAHYLASMCLLLFWITASSQPQRSQSRAVLKTMGPCQKSRPMGDSFCNFNQKRNEV
jgi:hypothetical protein